jgi:hypothetical protein
MIEVYFVQVYAPAPKSRAFARLLEHWKELSYRIESESGAPRFEIIVPVEDTKWRREMKEACAAGLIDDEWRAGYIRQEYTTEEVALAPLFSISHVGRHLKISTGRDHRSGLCHITTVEATGACPKCGAGATQSGPLRIPSAELNKAGRLASLMFGAKSFFMIPRSMVERIEEAVSDKLPLREVETIGSAKAKERWWQLDPKEVVPLGAVQERRYVRVVCPECGAVRLESLNVDGPYGGHFTLRKQSQTGKKLQPVVLQPFWDGDLTRFPDGRIKSIPHRRVWLRGDVARLLAEMKINGLDLTPIIFQ